MGDGSRRRGGVPWWTPLVGLVLLGAAVAVGIVARGGDSPAAAAPHEVLAVQTAAAPKRVASPLTAAGTALLPVPSTAALRGLAGRTVQAQAVPVREVVGPDIFWVGTSRAERILVHLQGGSASRPIRFGQRLSFAGVVAANASGAAAAWGLTAAEGATQFAGQRAHVEVFAPRIRFVGGA